MSILIPTHDRRGSLHSLLQSIRKQNLPTAKFEVIVVSNFPDTLLEQDIQDWQQELGNLKYFYVGKLGVNRARNLGIKHAVGEIFVFLDDDCLLLEENYLEKILRYHADHPEAMGIGGRYVHNRSANIWEITYSYICDLWLTNSKLGKNITSNLVGGNASYKATIFQKFNFAEEIIFGGAETEFNARLARKGYILKLFDDIPVEHRVSLKPRSFIFRAWRQGHAKKMFEFHGGAQDYRFYSHALSRREQMQEYALPEIELRPILWCFCIFDVVFRWAGEWAKIAVYEDRFSRISLEFLRQQLKAAWLRIRYSLFLHEICQMYRYYWR